MLITLGPTVAPSGHAASNSRPMVSEDDALSVLLTHSLTAPGCNKTHSQATLGDWRDPLDPDVEAQTIYAQLHNGRETLK